MNVRRDAAAIVGDRDRTIRIEGYGYDISMTGQGFIDGVVDDFVDHVMQARAVIRVADIHARTLAHGIEALENLDAVCAIFGIAAVIGYIGHFIEVFPVFRESRRLLTNQRFFLA